MRHVRETRSSVPVIAAALALLAVMVGCSEAGTPSALETPATASGTPGVAPTEAGEFEPDRYRHTIQEACGTGEISFCPPNAVPRRP